MVLQNGKRVRSKLLELRGLASHSRGIPSVGFVIPKHRQSAVDRNRLKRRLREIVRVKILPYLADIELVIRALPAAYSASVVELERDLTEQVTLLNQKLC